MHVFDNDISLIEDSGKLKGAISQNWLVNGIPNGESILY
jgi:hypothetical protein